jgi:hypothetical protein
VWSSVSTLHGAFIYTDARSRPLAAVSEVDRVATCSELRATFLGPYRQPDGFTSIGSVFSRKNARGIALWVSNFCDLPQLEEEASQNAAWALYLLKTKILPVAIPERKSKDKENTKEKTRSTEQFLLWDYIWQLTDIGKHAGTCRGCAHNGRWTMSGFGNTFFSVTTAVVAAALTNRTLVLPPSRLEWAHSSGFHDLSEALAFSSFPSSSAVEGHVKVMSWESFVAQMLADPKYNKDGDSAHHGSLCKEPTDNCVLTYEEDVLGIWYVPNPETALHYDENGDPYPTSPEFEAARQFNQRHVCNGDYKLMYDPECNQPRGGYYSLRIKPLPGIFDENGKPLDPRPTFLYTPASEAAYWTRFGGIDRERMARILHQTIKLHSDIEALAEEISRVSFDSQKAGGKPPYDCIHIRRGDTLSKRSFSYPASHTPVDVEAKRAASHLNGLTKILPVYVAVESMTTLSKNEMRVLESHLNRPVVYSPEARNRVCDMIPSGNEFGRVRKESCARNGGYVDIAVCRNARRFVGSFKSTYTDVIQEFRLRKWNEKKLRLLNGPPDDDTSASWLSWYF